MPSPGLERIKAIFVEAVEKSGSERLAFLHQACGNDAELLAEVEAFLAAADGAGDFLGSPASETLSTIAGVPGPSPGESPGSVIGRYKLLELIGEGGYGSVFMAEQDLPVRRKVALKIIKLGMDTKQVIARFEAEQQALAMMDHPNIAKVFEAGITQTGRPYFVMELVRGVPITEYCDSEKLTTHQRVELFIQVCNAIQHAHQKGVIHRDIKPSNVLVTMHDDKPVPKVIDFGIAKAIDQKLTEKTLFTEFRQFIGTPAYMSPEQAQMNEMDIDTRCDIYSLGVLLYELLTGATPFDQKKLREAAYEEIRRIIREDDPPKPSDRISTLGEKVQTVAALRRTEPAKLVHGLVGDLDWIVMKAMEKDRTRRYESASALAKDGQRYLNDEVVEASPPSVSYQLRRFARRYRRGLRIATVIALLLMATTAFSVWEAVRAMRAQAVVFANSESLTLLGNMLRQRNEFSEAGPFLRQGIAMKQQLHDTASPQYALNLLQLGLDLWFEGKRTESIVLTRQSLELERRVQPDAFQYPLLAHCRELQAMGDLLEAKDAGMEALASAQKALSVDASDRQTSLMVLASVECDLGDYSDAEQLARQRLDMARKYGTDAGHPVLSLALILFDEQKYEEAERLLRDGLQVDRGAPSPDNGAIAPEFSTLGALLSAEGKFEQAEPMLRQSLELLGAFSPPPGYDIAFSRTCLANSLSDQGKYAEADQLFTSAVQLCRTSLPPGNPGREWTMTCHASSLLKERNFIQSEPLFREALAAERETRGGKTLQARLTAQGLADLLTLTGRADDAEGLRKEFELSDPATQPSTRPSLSALPIPCINFFNQFP